MIKKFLHTITNQFEELDGQTVLDVANSAETEIIATPAELDRSLDHQQCFRTNQDNQVKSRPKGVHPQ